MDQPLPSPSRRYAPRGPRADVLGILNVTPDSFSDGGRYIEIGTAVDRAEVMIAEGANIIDVGGESTRPGATRVDEETEISRVVPVIEALAGSCRLSIDTRNERVARAAVKAGATIINDVSASLGPVAADLGVGWIAMHMQGGPDSMQRMPRYNNVVTEVRDYLVAKAEEANKMGVEEIWIDPGFGFGKTLQHNVELLANLDLFTSTGWPVAVGTSRKSMLGMLIGRSDGSEPAAVDERLVGSVTTATFAVMQGAVLVRVHDVKAAWQAVTVVAGEEH